MTRHHNKKSFLSQAKYDIQMRARAIEHRRKIREATMYGHAQGKIIREDTMYGNAQGNSIGEDREDAIYGNAQGNLIGEDREGAIYGHAQGKIIREDTMYGNAQGNSIGEDREDAIYGNAQGNLIGEDREGAIYGNVQEEMISRSSSGHENLNRLHKFTPEVQKQQNNSNFDTHYQNYCRCCNYSYCNCKAKNHSYFCSERLKCFKHFGLGSLPVNSSAWTFSRISVWSLSRISVWTFSRISIWTLSRNRLMVF
ncbi:high mobility group nucleosome-binding domain-containing protein 5-like [Rhizophagus irregularis DAOM 181602=DAOM 197198]|nr:high mobility group nucleosome-binding domain-containing protein 5-like [Rhizophagus irregularis DAOM 181602=DAOM 197198]